MNAEMERRWSLLVQQDDIVIVVGDLTAGLKNRKEDLRSLIGRLPGKKILVRGNHDHLKEKFYLDAGFLRVVDYISVCGLLFVHVPDTVTDANLEKTGSPHPWASLTKKLREKFNPVLTIHGHDHRANIPELEGHFNCAADRHNYMPFTLSTALRHAGIENLTEQARKDIYTWLEEKVADDHEKNVTLELNL